MGRVAAWKSAQEGAFGGCLFWRSSAGRAGELIAQVVRQSITTVGAQTSWG